MTKEKMLAIAEKNLKSAKYSLQFHYDRKGVTEQERENILRKVEYAQTVYDLISKYFKEDSNMNERYVIGKDHNTKDWFVYDNDTDTYICYCDTEEEAENFVRIQEMLIEQAEEYECTVEEVKQTLIEDWGTGGDRGYGIFEDDKGLLHIEKIDELDVYDDDLEAGKQAERDGIKLIPFELNPKQYPYNCYRFLDTEENRKLLKNL